MVTNAFHVSKAVDFFNRNDLYFGIGRTTRWTDDANPPIPDKSTKSLDELILYKQISMKTLVVKDLEGSIFYRGFTWSPVSVDEAYIKNATCVFLTATIPYEEITTTTYRQIGLYTHVVKRIGIPDKTVYYPSDVTSSILESIDNIQPTNRPGGKGESISIIIEF